MEDCTLCRVSEDLSALTQHLGVLKGKQLFIDDYLINETSGVQRVLNKPLEHPSPVMEATEHYEFNGQYGFGYPGSVNHNGTHFVMHYVAGQKVVAKGRSAKHTVGHMAVAVSVDGFTWQKQRLDFFTVHAPSGGEHCVLLDEHERNPELRWKMVHNCNVPVDETCLAVSADGITWMEKGHKWGRNVDRQACLYHDSAGGDYDFMLPQEFATPHSYRDIRGTQLLHIGERDFLHALLNNMTVSRQGKRGRVPFKLESSWYLDRYNKTERYEHVIYSQTRTLYEGVHLGLVTTLHWPMPGVIPGFRMAEKQRLFANVTGIEGWMHDRIVPYLATSRDGRKFNFQWVYAKQPLVRGNTTNAEPMRVVMPAAQVVTWGGWHWLYFAGTMQPHTLRWKGVCKIYLARWPQDRISGLETAPDVARSDDSGFVLTKPFRWPRGALALSVNINVGRRAGHAKGAGHSHNERTSRCALSLLTANGTVVPVGTIGEGESIGMNAEVRVAGLSLHELGDVQMRFEMRGIVRLYAFTITCGPCGCDGPPTDITCDRGNSFSKGLSGFDFEGQLSRATSTTQRMKAALATISDERHLNRAVNPTSLLEYGCATGITTSVAKEALRNVTSAIGFDVDEKAIARARARAGASGVQFFMATEVGDRTAELVLCQHVITVQSAAELKQKVRALLHFVSAPDGLLWIVFKKEADKSAVDRYVESLPPTEYVYILHNVDAKERHVPARSKQRDAYLYLLLSRRAAAYEQEPSVTSSWVEAS